MFRLPGGPAALLGAIHWRATHVQHSMMPSRKSGATTPGATPATYSPARLAAAANVSTDALRFYERKGLLPLAPRGSNGRRVYPAGALQRVRVIRSALSLGFTVAELREIFRIRDVGGSPCQTVCQMATAKLLEIEQTLAQLTATRDILAKSLRSWRRKLQSANHGARVGLLDMFAETYPERAQQLSPRISPGLRQRMQRPEPL